MLMLPVLIDVVSRRLLLSVLALPVVIEVDAVLAVIDWCW